ncbi:ribonuclease P protein component [Bordetella genomosp. 10]|uniref:Ribonuclease P protein component n=1 Tax=Bordetella genomosp. 10 TaxID=1416804 RepID=A0A261S5Z4_9BORD|nr:ribonuclease P protein component [Bordetella genomosp. 10]OZI32200.1 ribonuclease P protein component [Bordetella genomosp. 10]
MPRTTLPPGARMHRPSEFAAALKGRRLARGAFFMVTSAASTQAPGQACARLGLVIAKRHAALAVTRNALKRVIREAFRHCRHALPPADYVVRLHARVPAMSLTALKRLARAEVDTHFARVVRGPASKSVAGAARDKPATPAVATP